MARITYVEHGGREHVVEVPNGLTVMEGAIMQARTYRDLGAFDRNVAVLREHFDLLLAQAREEREPA